ncbi:hypothetical protein S40293_00720 [Stachybotrys chartarum IBT 40293]|nr:hypothetical protein S40293_00720 [Stachybotrys chartarum IBT 40293]
MQFFGSQEHLITRLYPYALRRERLCCAISSAADPDQDDLESSDISDIDDGDGHDDDHSSTIDDAGSQHPSRQSIDCLTLNAVFDGLVAAYNQEIPKLDSIPKPQRGNIERHDMTLKWLQADAGPQTRNAILEFLLHPLIRSYRVRFILERRSHTHVFDDFETFPLSWDASDIPYVLGISALHATQKSTPTAGESTPDPAYVGKAAAVSPDSGGHTLLPQRAREHVKGIKSAKKKIAGAHHPLSSTFSGILDPELKESTLPEEQLEILLARVGPTQLAQHRTSTLRFLISIMRSHHQDIFNGDQEDANDNHFWTLLFIGPLNPQWKIEDVKVLRYRFGWVLENIRSGTLSPEDSTASDAVGFYSKVHSTFARLCTPDRCAFLERLVQTADDWDDAIEKFKVAFSLEYSSSAIEYQARKQGLYIARISRSLIWTTEHEEYLASLLPEKPINVQQAIEHSVKMLNKKLHVTRSYNSVYTKAARLGLIGQRQGRSSVVRSTEEIKFLQSLQGQYLTTDKVRDRVWDYFGTKRSSGVVGAKWVEVLRNSGTMVTLSDGGAVPHPFYWMPEEDQFILEWEGNDLDALVDAFEAKFPRCRSRLAIRERWRIRESRSPGGPIQRILRWTAEEDNFIKEWSGTVSPEFAKAFHERFPVRGLKKQGDSEKWRCRWSAEEDELIITWLAENLIACEIAFQERFPGRRTETAVRRRWDTLRAKKMAKGDIAQLSGSVWLPELDEFILNRPDNQRSKCIAAFQKRFPNLRTDSAIKNRWKLFAK